MSRIPFRPSNWSLVVGMFVFIVALWAQSDALVGAFYDDGIYLVLARALAGGEGYVYSHLPGTPQAVHYPPFYPFVISLLWRIWPQFPNNLSLFQLFDSMALAGAAIVIANQIRKWATPHWIKSVAIVTSFSAFPLLTLVAVRFSEPLFLLLLAAAVSLADGEEISLRNAALAGLLAGFAILTRSVGLAALVGISISYLLRRDVRSAAVATVSGLIIVAPWLVHVRKYSAAIDSRLATVYGSYGDVVNGAGIGSVISGADLRVFGPAARLLIPSLPGVLWWLVACTVAGVSVYGAFKLWPRARALVLTLALYSTVVTVWPYAPDRFVWVLLPWWFLCLGAGLHHLYQFRGALRWIAIAVAAIVIVGFVPREVNALKGHRFTRTAEAISAPFGLLIPSVVQELPTDAVIASGDEALVFLYTGRQAVPASLVRFERSELLPFSAAETLRFYCENTVTHLFKSAEGDPVIDLVDHWESNFPGVLTQLFAVRSGPALYEVHCP